MARRRSAVDAAYRRIAGLRAIVAAERKRAEANPASLRNVELLITEVDQPRTGVERQIAALFNELDYLLDHLIISHMAASFEAEALPRLGRAVGEGRKVLEKDRKATVRWSSNLIRSADSFKGLHDIEQVLSLGPEGRTAFSKIRAIRNDFSHGGPIDGAPQITAEEARETLLDVLDRLT